MIETVTTSILLYLPGYLIDHYQSGSDTVIKLCITYVIVFSIYLIAAYLGNRVADYRRIAFEKSIKEDFFHGAIQKDYSDFHAVKIGEYISMQSNDITELCQNYLSPALSIIRSVIMIIIFGGMLFHFVVSHIC